MSKRALGVWTWCAGTGSDPRPGWQPYPPISVVIPVHNAGRTWRRVWSQCFGRRIGDLQVVCVDDGSSDDSGEMLEKHADADARVQLINQPNAGPGA